MAIPEEKLIRIRAWEGVRAIYEGLPAERRLDRMEADRFHIYELLLAPLEEIREAPESHPEGDLLYHSLQVFTLAREKLAYDEEFLTAALLHDVGKGLDRQNHVVAGLEALQGFVTPRTAWLIEHHVDALLLRNGTLGARSRRRLKSHESYDELVLLAQCDAAGRQVGMSVPTLGEAIEFLRGLAQANEADESSDAE